MISIKKILRHKRLVIALIAVLFLFALFFVMLAPLGVYSSTDWTQHPKYSEYRQKYANIFDTDNLPIGEFLENGHFPLNYPDYQHNSIRGRFSGFNNSGQYGMAVHSAEIPITAGTYTISFNYVFVNSWLDNTREFIRFGYVDENFNPVFEPVFTFTSTYSGKITLTYDVANSFTGRFFIAVSDGLFENNSISQWQFFEFTLSNISILGEYTGEDFIEDYLPDLENENSALLNENNELTNIVDFLTNENNELTDIVDFLESENSRLNELVSVMSDYHNYFTADYDFDSYLYSHYVPHHADIAKFDNHIATNNFNWQFIGVGKYYLYIPEYLLSLVGEGFINIQVVLESYSSAGKIIFSLGYDVARPTSNWLPLNSVWTEIAVTAPINRAVVKIISYDEKFDNEIVLKGFVDNIFLLDGKIDILDLVYQNGFENGQSFNSSVDYSKGYLDGAEQGSIEATNSWNNFLPSIFGGFGSFITEFKGIKLWNIDLLTILSAVSGVLITIIVIKAIRG